MTNNMTTDVLPLNLEKAILQGMSEVTRDRTLQLQARQMATAQPRPINFRGDVAEANQYDKIQPLSEGQASGNVVYIQGKSQKTGAVAHYQILGNQWGLMEALAKLA